METRPHNKLIIIAHRGAQSIYPEHTLEAYKKAIEMGADFIEPDLVMTKDGYLVARHEPYISRTTDVALKEEYAHLKTTKVVDGVEVTDWFVSDFTLTQIKSLKAKQARKDRSSQYDGQFTIATLEEIIDLAKKNTTSSGNEVGIYPEIKHPTFHNDLGLPIRKKLLEALTNAGWNHSEAPVYIQCFEVETLQEIHRESNVKLIQLLGAVGMDTSGKLKFRNDDNSYHPEGTPYDFYLKGDKRTYKYFTTEEGLKFAATYASGIGPWKGFIIPYAIVENGTTEIKDPTDFVTLAHTYNLSVHPYTFRNEDEQYMTAQDPQSEYSLFFEAGVDGLFSDYTDEAVRAKNNFLNRK